MNNEELNYLKLLQNILDKGNDRVDRTGVGTRAVFGRELRFDLSQGFPLLTTKKVHFKSIAVELIWFLSGNTNTKFLVDNKVTIWNEWADSDGNLGPVYGSQWRSWPTKDGKTIDQISNLINRIQKDPTSRRLMVSAWNVEAVESGTMKLPPCHYTYQFFIENNKLSCWFSMRSTDTFLGLPFNIASYALLTHMIAQQCNLEVGELIYYGGDVHVYKNHVTQVQEQLSRTPFDFPTLKIKRKPNSVFEYNFDDFEIENYQSHPGIKAPVAI